MTKTKEELNEIKEAATTSMKFNELTDEDLAQVSGGVGSNIYSDPGDNWDKNNINDMFTNNQGNENLNINNDPQSLNEQFKEKAKVIELEHF